MAMGVKILRVVSAEEFLTVLFTYSKGLMLLLTFAVDQRVFAWTALMTVGARATRRPGRQSHSPTRARD